jgi:hypothetical protein
VLNGCWRGSELELRTGIAHYGADQIRYALAPIVDAMVSFAVFAMYCMDLHLGKHEHVN